MNNKFESNYTVYYEDTDTSGFTYHTTYLKFSERARSEILNNFFPEIKNSLKDNSFFFVVKDINVNFIKPTHLFDELKVITSYVDNSYTSLKLNHLITFENKRVCEINVKLVWIDGSSERPVKIPKNIISRLKPSEIV